MKKIALLIAGIALIFNFSSCKPNEDSEKESQLDKYFKIANAELVNEEFPSASSSSNRPVILNLTGNTSVIPGGTNTVHLRADRDIEYILIGVEGEFGYYKLPASNAKSMDYEFFMLMSQELRDDVFALMVAIEDPNLLVSEAQKINVDYVDAGTGVLQVNCSWDQPNDVDLHLVEPNGEEIYFANSVSQNGGELDVDSNAGCSLDNINNENITYDTNDVLEAGEYIVKVDLFSNCNVSGDTHYIVTAYHNGQLITPENNTSNPYRGTFTSGDADSGGPGVEVMRFHINANRSTKVYKFNFNKKNKVLSPEKLQQ